MSDRHGQWLIKHEWGGGSAKLSEHSTCTQPWEAQSSR